MNTSLELEHVRLNREGEAAAYEYIAQYHNGANTGVEALVMVIPHRGGVNHYWALLHDTRNWPHGSKYTAWSKTWGEPEFGKTMTELVDDLCRYYKYEITTILKQYNDYLLRVSPDVYG